MAKEKQPTAAQWQARAIKAEQRLELRETESECRALVQWFSAEMLNRFRSNADRGSRWTAQSVDELMVKLDENVDDLRKALEGKNPATVIHRCADLANVAAMIGDHSDSAK
jgi:hypothetical protein